MLWWVDLCRINRHRNRWCPTNGVCS